MTGTNNLMWSYGSAGGAGDAFTISGGADVNVFDAAVTAGVPVGGVVDLTVTVTGDVTRIIWGTGWVGGSTFTLVNNGNIYGRGGDGGFFGADADDEDGADGEDAMDLAGLTVSITNNGNIWGGGGGGGAGGSYTLASSVAGDTLNAIAGKAGGGGGAGGEVSTGGVNAFGLYITIGGGPPVQSADNILTTLNFTNGGTISSTQVSTDGTDGDDTGPGTGGISSNCTGTSITGDSGDGGDGGDFGAAGEDGEAATGSATNITVLSPAGVGGAAGKAIELSGGTANFLSGNNASQVKGAVS